MTGCLSDSDVSLGKENPQTEMNKLLFGHTAPGCVLWLAMITCGISWAQPIIIVPPLVDSITPTSARVTWVTNLASSTKLKFGLTTAYDGLTTGQLGVTTDHSWYLSGLKPDTTYNYQACSAVSGAEICSSNQTLTTAARTGGAPGPAIPALPLEVPTAPPAGSYGPTFYVDAQCSNLPAILTSLANLTGSLHYVVQVPAGTTCYGQYTFPQRRNHTGWVIVRTSSPDSSFAVAGERVQEGDSPVLAKFVTDILPAFWFKASAIPSSCTRGVFGWAFDVPGFAVYECTNRTTSDPRPISSMSSDLDKAILSIPGHGFVTGDLVKVAGTATVLDGNWRITVLTPDTFRLENSSVGLMVAGSLVGTATRYDMWSPIPFTVSAGPPSGSCTPNDWLYRSDMTPNTRAIFWCTSPGVWTRMRAYNVGDKTQHAAIQLAANASRYQFVGLEVTHVPVPNPPPASWSLAPYTQGEYGALVLLQDTNSSIIIDRCNIHGLDYPSRLAYGIIMNGANVALLSSRVTRVNRWTEAVVPGTTGQEAIAINTQLGPGPGRVENNFIEAIGMTVFFPNSASSTVPPAHYVIRKNHFSHPDKYLYGSPLNTSGKNYMNRQVIELKTGRYFLIEGNLFDGNWMDVTQGAVILLTPRASYTSVVMTVTAISGNTITFNANMNYQPGMLLKFVNTTNGQIVVGQVLSVPNPASVVLTNPPDGLALGARTTAIASPMQISDITIRNNIFRNAPNVLWVAGHDTQNSLPTTLTTSRVAFTNNLMYGINALGAADGGRNSPLSISPNGRTGIMAFAANGVEDLIIRNNTLGDFKGMSPTLLFNESTLYGSNSGLDVRDNIFAAPGAATGPIPNSISSASRGKAGLDLQWTEFPSPVWTYQNNAFCCAAPAATVASAPPGNIWLSTMTEVGFANPAAGDYALLHVSTILAGKVCPSVPTITCSSNGKDLGADMTALKAATAKTVSGLK